MNNPIKIDAEYKQWIAELSERFQKSQLQASIRVNTEMLRFYWSLGEDIVKLQAENGWGSGFFEKLSIDLQHELPNTKGFSPRNLRYMKSFYLLYSRLSPILPQAGAKLQSADNEDAVFLPQLEAKIFSIPWGHHKCIIDKNSNNPQKAIFFVQKTIENAWELLCWEPILEAYPN